MRNECSFHGFSSSVVPMAPVVAHDEIQESKDSNFRAFSYLNELLSTYINANLIL